MVFWLGQELLDLLATEDSPALELELQGQRVWVSSRVAPSQGLQLLA